MKRLLVILLAFFSIHTHAAIPPKIASPTPTATPTPSVLPAPYTFSSIMVASASAITLIPNFKDKSDAKTLLDANRCNSAITGGFYDTAHKPLGYFYADGHVYGSEIKSDLVNGFFWADTDSVAVISAELPAGMPLRFALQSGPLLFFDGKPIPLASSDDAHARRMIVAKTMDNHYIFLAIYSTDSVFSGPTLNELPEVMATLNTKEQLDIVDALNLDGGDASAFYTEGTHLSELASVGSLFCIK